MSYQKRTPAHSYHVKARIHLVYIGFQQSSRYSIRHTRYSSRKMACHLAPKCNFLHGFFQCNLWKDIIDVEITVRTLKGMHTFRKDCSSQSSMCSPWDSCIKPFPSLWRKMEDYLKERQTIANPFHVRSLKKGREPLKPTQGR